jgi:myo-inositol 2-dehydrogenase/D-chiro-inositol 1-dehydrogenase
MPVMASRGPFRRVNRRSFLGGSLAAVAASAVPGGAFAAGSDRVRIGLVGCGGRGTGAALQAATADPGVVITALGDLFSDQVDATTAMLSASLGRRFDCPAERRFAAADAGLRVIASDVDAVILATPPYLRPGHVVAAVQAGRHVFCETPTAVDAAGVRTMLAVADLARTRGLSFVSGFHSRHHAPTVATITRILEGEIGRPLRGVAISHIGLPWRREPQPGSTPAETVQRNWITDDRLSGGGFVEHHVHAIDRAIWALGDDAPTAATAVHAEAFLPPAVATPTTATIHYRFADGRSLEACLVRREDIEMRIEESLEATAGRADLRQHTLVGNILRDPARSGSDGRHGDGQVASGHAAGVASLVRALRSGRRVDDLETACRSTMIAVMGRMASESRDEVSWHDLWPRVTESSPLRPLQCSRV